VARAVAVVAGTYSNALTFNSASNAFTGVGSALSSLNASNLASGTCRRLCGGDVQQRPDANSGAMLSAWVGAVEFKRQQLAIGTVPSQCGGTTATL